jgi:hypothetical protein
VILRPATPHFDRAALFLAFGKFVDDLGGHYITAEDSGTGLEDMEVIRTVTKFVCVVDAIHGGSGDPSPFTALGEVSKAILDSSIRLGAQNMSEHNVGAYTGEIAAVMLKEFSVRYVLLGHSERRQYQKEPDALIARKAAAVRGFTKPIVCIGRAG